MTKPPNHMTLLHEMCELYARQQLITHFSDNKSTLFNQQTWVEISFRSSTLDFDVHTFQKTERKNSVINLQMIV